MTGLNRGWNLALQANDAETLDLADQRSRRSISQ